MGIMFEIKLGTSHVDFNHTAILAWLPNAYESLFVLFISEAWWPLIIALAFSLRATRLSKCLSMSTYLVNWDQSVLRTTIKVHGKSQNLTPATPKHLNRSSPFGDDRLRCLGVAGVNLCHYVVDVYHPAKFHPDLITGFLSAHARFRASNCLLGYLFCFFVLC